MNRLGVHVVKTAQFTILSGVIVLLTSCAATQTALEHRTLETQTNLSKTIFLDPVPSSQKTIFVAIKTHQIKQLTLNDL